jgi:ribosomal protein S11
MGTDDIIRNATDGDGHKLATILLISGAVGFFVTAVMMPFLAKRCEEAVAAAAKADGLEMLDMSETGTASAAAASSLAPGGEVSSSRSALTLLLYILHLPTPLRHPLTIFLTLPG